MSLRALEKLKGRFGDAVLSTHSDRGDDTAVVQKDVIDVMFPARGRGARVRHARDDRGRRTSATAFGSSTPVLDEDEERVRVKCQVPSDGDGNGANIGSVVGVFSGANASSARSSTCTGSVDGHPGLRRIFLYDSCRPPAAQGLSQEKRQPLFRREGNS